MNDKWHRLEVENESIKFNISNIPEINNKELKDKVSYMLIGYTYLIFLCIKDGNLDKLIELMKDTAKQLKGGDKNESRSKEDTNGFVGWSKE